MWWRRREEEENKSFFPSAWLYLSGAALNDKPMPSGAESQSDLDSTRRVFELLIVQSLWQIAGGVVGFGDEALSKQPSVQV